MAKGKKKNGSLEPPKPNPALRRLEKLLGAWSIRGRTLDSKEDNVSGRLTVEWLPGGFFLQQRAEMDFVGFKIRSLEIVFYDPSTKAFSSNVYSNIGGVPRPYQWDVQGNIVTHWEEGSKFSGKFSKDGKTLSGGWRPEKGKQSVENIAYNATMTRVK
jgi:hypothetical protein